MSDVPAHGSLREVALLFLKLGCTAFGGPAAHISLMRREVVERRHWITDGEFLDLLGGANMIPGPSSTEMGILLGYRRAGPLGLLVAGSLFITPAMLMVLALAWAYTRFGTLPATGWLLYGIKPAVIAIVVLALWGLGRTAFKTPVSPIIGAGALALYLLGINPLPILVAAAVVGLAITGGEMWVRARKSVESAAGALLIAMGAAPRFSDGHKTAISLRVLFLTLLKIGAVLYGGGYVLLAFVQDDFVHHLGWLTSKQVLDAVAIGQITPGPLFTTATFIGYLVAGLPGALVATLAIFLPAFIYTPLVFPLLPRLRRSPLFRGLLDGVNVSALGLMAGVTVQLGRTAIVDPLTATLAILCLVALRYKCAPVLLLLACGAIGVGSKAIFT